MRDASSLEEKFLRFVSRCHHRITSDSTFSAWTSQNSPVRSAQTENALCGWNSRAPFVLSEGDSSLFRKFVDSVFSVTFSLSLVIVYHCEILVGEIHFLLFFLFVCLFFFFFGQLVILE